jgi:glutaredoxin-related protein
MTGNVVNIRDYAPKATAAESLPHEKAPARTSLTIEVRDAVGGTVAPIADLYPEDAGRSLPLASALSLLAEGLAAIDGAIAARGESDVVASDDRLMQFFALTPELFCCRDLGDGFSQAVASLCALHVNFDTVDISEEQLRALRRFVSGLREAPFLSLESAIDAQMKLEGVGLPIDLEPLGVLLGENE